MRARVCVYKNVRVTHDLSFPQVHSISDVHLNFVWIRALGVIVMLLPFPFLSFLSFPFLLHQRLGLCSFHRGSLNIVRLKDTK